MKMLSTLMFVFAVASSALGECPVPPTVPGADIGKIAGRWYEMAGPTFSGFPQNFTCMTYDFTPRKDGNFNLTILATLPDGSMSDELMLAERADDQNLLNLYEMTRRTEYPVTFYTADTDYDNYMAAYTCFIVPPRTTMQSGLILSRTSSMNPEKYAKMYDLLVKQVGVSSDRVGPIAQKDCRYRPVPQ